MISRPVELFEQALVELEAKVDTDQAAHLTADIPARLYHYTNAQGLIGILKSERIWATNYRYLNDTGEIAYGIGILDDVLAAAKAEGKVAEEFLSRARETANAFNGIVDCYVACLCERGNLLNQWREYADKGGGFALGFAARKLANGEGHADRKRNVSLRRVIYRQELQRELVEALVYGILKAIELATDGFRDEPHEVLVAQACSFLRVNVAEYLVCFKHPAFESEHEWRLVHITDPLDEEHVQFRAGPYGVTPYVELDPTPTAGVYANLLPVECVVHGPTQDPSNVRHALAKLLRPNHSHTEVSGIDLTMRI